MSSAGSVTLWVRALKAGDSAGAQPLWERYFRRLVGLARAHLRGVPRRVADEEDVVVSAFDSFCRGAERGHFPRLDDRDDLWKVLVMITARKASDLAKYNRRQKRGGETHEALDPDDLESVLAHIPAPDPDPAFAALMTEECERLLGRLGSPELRALALLKLEGFTAEELAKKLGRTRRTVERKLRLIRRIWQGELEP